MIEEVEAPDSREEAHVQQTEGGVEYWLARDIQQPPQPLQDAPVPCPLSR